MFRISLASAALLYASPILGGEFTLSFLAANGKPLSNSKVKYQIFAPVGSDDLGKEIARGDQTTDLHGALPAPVRFPDRSTGLELPQVTLQVSLDSDSSFQAFLPDLARESGHRLTVVLSQRLVYYETKELTGLAMAIDGCGYSFRIAGSRGTVTRRASESTPLSVDQLTYRQENNRFYFYDSSDRVHSAEVPTIYAIRKHLIHRRLCDRCGRAVYVPCEAEVWRSDGGGKPGTWCRIGTLRWQHATTTATTEIQVRKNVRSTSSAN
ncbi:MAG: hypothetical protein KDA42_10650 [Planctomycetales bacterium]|nr:hypothetical protein [Planctomycetales bacterium]